MPRSKRFCRQLVPDLLDYDHAPYQPVVALVVTGHRAFARGCAGSGLSDDRVVDHLSALSQAGRPKIGSGLNVTW